MNLDRTNTVTFINSSQLDDLMVELRRHGFSLFVLRGANVFDKISLFAQANSDLPHELGMETKRSWDAFLDNVLGGIYMLGSPKIAFVWVHVEAMLAHGLQDLVSAIECFRDMASELINPSSAELSSAELKVFLVGDGANFPLWSTTTQ